MAWKSGPVVRFFQDRAAKAQVKIEKNEAQHGGTPPYKVVSSEYHAATGNAPRPSVLPSVTSALEEARSMIRLNDEKAHQFTHDPSGDTRGFTYAQQPVFLPRYEQTITITYVEPPGKSRDHRDDPQPSGWGGSDGDSGGPPHPPGPPPPGYTSW